MSTPAASILAIRSVAEMENWDFELADLIGQRVPGPAVEYRLPEAGRCDMGVNIHDGHGCSDLSGSGIAQQHGSGATQDRPRFRRASAP